MRLAIRILAFALALVSVPAAAAPRGAHRAVKRPKATRVQPVEAPPPAPEPAAPPPPEPAKHGSVGFSVTESMVVPPAPTVAADRPASEAPAKATADRPASWTVGLGSTLVMPAKPSADGLAAVTALSASYAVTRSIAPFLRVPLVTMHSRESGDTTFFANPAVGAGFTWAPSAQWKLNLSLQSTIPIGRGVEDDEDRVGEVLKTVRGATQFVNYTAFGPTAGASYGGAPHVLLGGRIAATQFIRVRGENVDSEAARTQVGATATVGLSPSRESLRAPLLFFAEARYLLWATQTEASMRDVTARDNLMAALGARVRVPTDFGFMGGALAYAAAVDAPLVRYGYHTFELDLQVGF